MTVTRANVEATKAFIRARLGNPYVYGGALSPTNVRQGTDCSEVCQTVLEMALGRYRPGRQSEGATTESYRYIDIGGVGPFGTIRVASPRDIPANAAVKVALHHGPGGGANSHMWCEIDGMRVESGGSKGLVTQPSALAIDNPYATAWCYLPGPIVDDGTPVAQPVLGVGSTGPEVVALQQQLNTEGAGLEVDGDYGPATAAAFAAFQRRTPYALATIAEGRRRNISPRGIQIALSVPFVETGWKMYANSNVPESLTIPHDAVGSDHDSVGLWQQRCPMWGPAAVLMDPTLSAGLFFDRLVKVNLGTIQSPIYYDNTSRLPGDFAAEVQRPAVEYRGRYQERMGHAVALYNRLSATQTGDEEFMAALSANEQREVLDLLRVLASNPYPSRSPLRRLGEGNIDTIAGIGLNEDGNVHVVVSILLGLVGDPKTLDDLAELANADLTKFPDRAGGKALAHRILVFIATINPAALQAQNGVSA